MDAGGRDHDVWVRVVRCAEEYGCRGNAAMLVIFGIRIAGRAIGF